MTAPRGGPLSYLCRTQVFYRAWPAFWTALSPWYLVDCDPQGIDLFLKCPNAVLHFLLQGEVICHCGLNSLCNHSWLCQDVPVFISHTDV